MTKISSWTIVASVIRWRSNVQLDKFCVNGFYVVLSLVKLRNMPDALCHADRQ